MRELLTKHTNLTKALIINELKNSLLSINTLAESTKNSYLNIW